MTIGCCRCRGNCCITTTRFWCGTANLIWCAPRPDRLIPSIHPNYSPTFGIRPGDPVTFKVRTFNTTDGSETWDFGDGSPTAEVQSDGNAVKLAPDGYAETVHRYAEPGDYVVRVERTDGFGVRAVGCLHVRVEE